MSENKMSGVHRLPARWSLKRSRAALFYTASRYGVYLLAWGVPAIIGMAIYLLIQQRTRGYVFVFQQDLTVLLFWICLLAAGLATIVIAFCRWADARVATARREEQQAVLGARRRLLRNLDHELRTPLTTIGLITEKLRLAEGSAAEREAAYEGILQQMRRMQTLIKGLRFLVDQDENHIVRASVDLEETLQEAVEIVQSSPVYQGQPIEMDIQPHPRPLPLVWGDHDCLVVVFRNLLENAVKFSDASCRVSIRAWEEAGWVVVTVSDTGPGIPPEDLPYVFESLYRGKNAARTPGSGLGLAAASRLVHLNRGTLHIDSTIGKGTVLTVRLRQMKTTSS